MLDCKKVKRLRNDRALTQAELCDIAGLTIPTLSTIENGHRDSVAMGTLHKLAKALKVKPAELLK